MSRPTRGQVHIDRGLTNMSVAYMQSANMFIAAKVFPQVPVEKQSDRYFVYLKEDWFRDEATERAPGTESAGGGYEIDNTPTYFARKYAYHIDVTEEDRTNADEGINSDRDAVDFVSQKLLIRREVIWSQQYFIPGAWPQQLVGVAAAPGAGQFLRWDQPGSTPIKDISAAKMVIASQTGMVPNVLVLAANVYEALRNHDDILGRIVFTQKGIVTADILASLFDVDRVEVAWGVRNVAPKMPGVPANENTNFLLGNHALLAYAAPRPALKTPSAGYIFAWKGLLGAGAYANRIRRIQMPALGEGTERIEGEMAFDARRVSPELGFFFASAVL